KATPRQESRGEMTGLLTSVQASGGTIVTQPNGGIRMTDRSFRAITLGLLASTALATPALAQNAQPQNTQGQAPSGAVNSTDVTAPAPKVQQAQAPAGQPAQAEIVLT